MSRSSLACFESDSIQEALRRAMKATALYQHVMAIRDLVLARARTSLRTRATQEAAKIAAGDAWGRD